MPVAARETKSPANIALNGTAAGGGHEFAVACDQVALFGAGCLGVSLPDRFVGPETVETKVFGRLTAWQNWIFVRPDACGPDGALRRFGTGRKGEYDFGRI